MQLSGGYCQSLLASIEVQVSSDAELLKIDVMQGCIVL